MLHYLQRYFQKTYRQWLNQRIPSKAVHVLNNRNIFIFLSKAGYAFCGVLLLILVVAVNYQNNAVFLLLFVLCSLFVVALFHAYNNVYGLSVEAITASNTYVGDDSEIAFRFFSTRDVQHVSIRAAFVGETDMLIDVCEGKTTEESLHLLADKRGHLSLPRLLVESYYPFGLFRVWTWLPFSVDAVVYPLPIKNVLPVMLSEDVGSDNEVYDLHGDGDFYGFKTYQMGDSLKKVHWASYAKGQPLQAKEYASETSDSHTLNMNSFGGSLEQRLSSMCYWVVVYGKRQSYYSVIIDGVCYGPDNSMQFTNSILRILALYRMGRDNVSG